VGFLVSIIPAWRTARGAVQSALRSGGSATTSDRGALRTRATLLAVQVTVSVTLIIVTALLSVSFVRLMHVDRGFSADRVLAVGVSMPAERYEQAGARLPVYDRLLAAIHAVPGVESATTTSLLPLSGQGQVNSIVAEGDPRPKSDQATANFRFVAPDYFQTLGMSILHGRSFTETERDPTRPAPVLVSESTAARLWPGKNALGQRFSRGLPQEQHFEVVGIVAEARTTSIDATPPYMVYVPYWWRSRTSFTVLIKTAVEPTSVLPGVRRAVAGIDPEIAIGRTRTVDDIVDASFAGRRYQMRLFIAFGAAALAIAVLGVYAVTAYGVSRRRREMNIRVALGARTSQVIAMVLRQGSLPIVAGALAGAAGAIAIGDLVRSLLFDVQPRDPIVIAATVVLVAAIGVAACLLATRQGLRLEPAAALRED
jgi:predicted permease